LVANNCPHRGASLFFGRNEEAGLRCVYHGWKFDVAGNCIDMPNEPAESDFRTKVTAVAYPCQERGGLVWIYMGPRSTPPPLPDLEGNMQPGAEEYVRATQLQSNWLQILEGDIDTTHVGFCTTAGSKPRTRFRAASRSSSCARRRRISRSSTPKPARRTAPASQLGPTRC